MDNVFQFRDQLIERYGSFSRSFVRIAAPDIQAEVEHQYAQGRYWPEPLVQINPNYQRQGTVQNLAAQGVLHAACAEIFQVGKSEGSPEPLHLYKHQMEALAKGQERQSYVVTTGTGSGKSLPGSSLNDIFICVASGAVRKYLSHKGELPEQSLISLMPISLRTDASAGGNDVSGVQVKIRSDIADPIERLRAVHHETRESKAKAEKLGLDMLKNLFEVMPGMLVDPLMRALILPSINLATSNVRGPDKPLYLAGAKAMCMYPVSIPADGAGLNFTGVSYNGVMWVSMVSCRKMLPDPGLMLACMNESWNELLAAADKLPKAATKDSTGPATRAVRRRNSRKDT